MRGLLSSMVPGVAALTGGYAAFAISMIRRRVGNAKRAHRHDPRVNGGHASLCPPYKSWLSVSSSA